ncbi:hypothetical protein C900_05316 [Fulvivirga imtechensis AK7]|uniref:DUF2141 domain-containing protein n=1 Tax=Fulvivirga imtechensis AK7 TaxID=1237149 RepID=L8JKE6_9BACT|nr:DUF2141 domain-containing protein [Fulvivirga imtechensis]ELR69245.1 hypothetical protein C900_05316 [Fulvivirga imtechensis AK7]
MKTLLFIAVFLAAGVLNAQSNDTQRLVKLTVEVEGELPSRGKLLLTLFDSEAAWLKKEVKAMSIDVTSTKDYVFEIEGLPVGTYAVSIIHDENNNGKLDMGVMGPEEGYGFSNNARSMFGPAPFHKAAMEVPEDTKTTIQIK